MVDIKPGTILKKLGTFLLYKGGKEERGGGREKGEGREEERDF